VTRNPVVHHGSLPTEQQFHSAFINGLRTMRRKFHTDKAFAKALGLTTKGVSKIYAGGLTCPKRMWDALSLDENFLDEIAALYGRKVVPAEHGDGRAAPTIVALLHEVIEAEADGKLTNGELLAMDDELAAAEKVIGGLRASVRKVKAARERVAELVA
jgi:hypothetical protein